MNIEITRLWQQLPITRKFRIVFLLLLILFLLIAFTGYFATDHIRHAEKIIQTNRDIAHKVLEMDRGLERAYRLHGDFFLTYHHIGMQKAHELYAQPSIRAIAEVVQISSELGSDLFDKEVIPIMPDHQKDVNLYLATAKRFAATSIQSYELLTERVAPERGLEEQLARLQQQIGSELAATPDSISIFRKAIDHYREYIIYRQRPLMQASQNDFAELNRQLAGSPLLPMNQQATLLALIGEHERLVEKLLEVDLQLATRMVDFHLQRQTVMPISETLIQLTKQQADEAERSIDQVHQVAVAIIGIATVMALLMLLYISRTIHLSITCNVVNLARAVEKFQQGKLEARVPVASGDELGQLAMGFNTMAANLKDLIDNLEQQVEDRTRELAKSEERFRQLVCDLPNIAVQGYDQELRVTYWNPACHRLFGYSNSEASGQPILERIVPGDRLESLCRAVRELHQNDFAIGPSEMIFTNKDQQEVVVYGAFVRQQDSSGNVTVYIVGVDLGELKKAQAALSMSESFYRQLFNHSSSGVVVYEPTSDGRDFIICDLNLASERIEQRSREDAIGRSVREVFPGLEETGLLAVLRKVHITGEPARPPPFYYQDQKVRGWRENRVYRLPSGEIVTVYEDITGRKTSEEEKVVLEHRLQSAQKMEAIGLMAGGIAHDLNNTLSAIVGFPELLLMQIPDDSPLRKPLVTIREAGERASAVVADMLTIARGVASTREVVDLNTLVRQWLSSEEFLELQRRFPQVQIIRLYSSEPAMIDCSAVHIRKCLANLLANSIDSMKGSGTITLAITIDQAGQDLASRYGLLPQPHVLLMISDHGPQIAKHHLEHLFEPFYLKRAMGRTSGTGLGLSMVWNTLKDHEGLAAAASSDEETTYTLFFPLSLSKTDIATESGTPLNLAANGEAILVVDDEPHQRQLVEQFLSHYGYTVVCSSSGEEAIDYLRNHQVDLLVLDMIMTPGISGRETYQEILKFAPGQKAIVASGFSESDDVRATLEMGAAAFIKKPFTMAELARTVKQAIIKE